MNEKSVTPAFLVNPFVLAGMTIMLLAMILACGCISQQASVRPGDDLYTEPIVGTWVHDPGSADSPLFLYIFKEYGRFDAVAMTRDPAVPLPFEEWVTGTWTIQGAGEYILNGEAIRNNFMNGSHTTLPVREILVYDPQNDILVNRERPAGVFQRFSHEPVIPPGLDISIPWD